MNGNYKRVQGIIFNKLYFTYFFVIGRLIADTFLTFGLDKINVYFTYCYCGWAIIIIFYDLVKKKILRSNLQKYGLIFFGICVLSYMLWPSAYRIGAIIRFSRLIIMVYLFFSMSLDYSKEQFDFFLRRLSLLVVIYLLVLNCCSIIAYFGSNYQIDISAIRYTGIYSDMNLAGFMCYLAVLLTFFLYSKKTIGIFTMIVSFVISTIMLILTNCRTAEICYFIAIIFFCILFLKTKIKKHYFLCGTVLGVAVSIVLLFATTPILIAANNAIGIRQSSDIGRDYDISLTEQSNSESPASESFGDIVTTEDELSSFLSNKSDLYRKINTISSLRLCLWDSSIQTWIKRPILGYGWQNNNLTFNLILSFSNSHNIIMNTLLWSGLAGLLSLLWWLSKVVISIKKMYKTIIGDNNTWLMITIICIFLSSLNEQVILGNTFIVSAYFWILIGYLGLYNQIDCLKSDQFDD